MDDESQAIYEEGLRDAERERQNQEEYERREGLCPSCGGKAGVQEGPEPDAGVEYVCFKENDWTHFLSRINYGASALDARAIRVMNEPRRVRLPDKDAEPPLPDQRKNYRESEGLSD